VIIAEHVPSPFNCYFISN